MANSGAPKPRRGPVLSLGSRIKSCLYRARHQPRPNNLTNRSLANFSTRWPATLLLSCTVHQPKLTAPSSASDSTSGHGGQPRTMAPTVEIRNLTFTYPGIDGKPPPGAPPLIEDVCFSLEAGQRCLLVGSNGAGNSWPLSPSSARLVSVVLFAGFDLGACWGQVRQRY